MWSTPRGRPEDSTSPERGGAGGRSGGIGGRPCALLCFPRTGAYGRLFSGMRRAERVYNEDDQPVCRVCNVALRSDSLWPAHQASRKHHEGPTSLIDDLTYLLILAISNQAIENIKATAARQSTPDNSHLERQQNFPESRAASTLPDNFFDSQDAKKQKHALVTLPFADVQQGTFVYCCLFLPLVNIGHQFILEDSKEHKGEEKKQATKSDVKNSSGSGSSRSSVSKEEDENITAGSSVQSSKQMSHNDVMQVSAVLPEGLPNNGTDEKHNSNQKSQVSRDYKNLEVKEARAFLPSGFFDRIDSNSVGQAKQLSQQSEKPDIVQLKQVKEALPEGFFDNKDEDLRARGIEPVKVDIECFDCKYDCFDIFTWKPSPDVVVEFCSDAYKEFEREIQEDLQEVDDRLEEEEIDAAEVREEIESLEYKAYRERVEMVKKKLLEAKESRLARLQRSPEFKAKDSSDDSSSDDEVDEDFSVDWRAKRF
ncbi:hypothetical protein MA16_Dca025872 [Dendrobium catenatum]|uniref:C2H2-type domain-containing protein n=1 Tax=Dendrobium catenatum TaxID=906689 RepID=A0A2I0WWB8_9ASPA|nr:hypothetical protein MA16_Dca025872 [Dendrobium catenatum]